MKPGIPLVSLALAFCTSLTAQTYVTAPAGFETNGKSAGYFASCRPFAFLNGGVQIGDPSLPKKVMVLTKLEYRTQTFASYNLRVGQGRKFSRVTLFLGHCDVTKMTSNFLTNRIGKVTVVYQAATSLPTHDQGIPTQTWGNAGSFPFRTNFSYNGKNDLLMQWGMVGGVLNNGAKPFAAADYFVDAGISTTANNLRVYPGSPYAPGSRYVPEPPFQGTRCSDSGQLSTADAYTYVSLFVYGDNYSVRTLRGKGQFGHSRAFYLARSTKYTGVLTFSGFDAGIPIGAACNKLHVYMGFPLIFSFGITDGAGHTPNWVPPAAFPYDPKLAGQSFFAQAVWDDTKTRKLTLSKAVKLTLPKKPTGQPTWPAATLVYKYTDRNGKDNGPFAPLSGAVFNYTERFTTK